MVKIADMALAELYDIPDAKVDAIVAEVGELTGVIPEYLVKYYPAVTAGTRLSGSRLDVISITSEALCHDCGAHYRPSRDNDYRCPHCKSINSRFIHGRELNLKEIILK